MRVLIFDLIGKFAHFRKFYANSSSLSYPYPPRTTMEGILGGILGYDRDAYYDVFGMDSADIAVSGRTQVRSLIQRVNNLYVKDNRGFAGSRGRTQTPYEIILPYNFNERLVFRAYVHHKDDRILDRLKEKIVSNKPYYPTSLGAAQFLSSTEFIADVESSTSSVKSENGMKEICTSVPKWQVSIKDLMNMVNSNKQIMQDIFPVHFMDGRIPGRNMEFIYERRLRNIWYQDSVPSIRVEYEHGEKREADEVVFPTYEKDQIE